MKEQKLHNWIAGRIKTKNEVECDVKCPYLGGGGVKMKCALFCGKDIKYDMLTPPIGKTIVIYNRCLLCKEMFK